MAILKRPIDFGYWSLAIVPFVETGGSLSLKQKMTSL